MLVKQLSSQEANLRLLVNEWGSKNTTTTTKRTFDVQSCKATLVVRAEQSGQQISTKGLADNLKGVKILKQTNVCLCWCMRVRVCVCMSVVLSVKVEEKFVSCNIDRFLECKAFNIYYNFFNAVCK